MSSGIDKAVNDLVQVIQEAGKNKTAPLDAQAEVRRIEGDIAWVHIAGGVDETPVRLTINARAGDKVQVRLAGGRAWLTGNATNPPTDDTEALVAKGIAITADNKSEEALFDAGRAKAAADLAESEAVRAKGAADDATEQAVLATNSAGIATRSANVALDQLGIVENVVGVLNLVSKHGNYLVTMDQVVNPNKWYFTRFGEAPNYEYSVVSNPSNIEYVLTSDETPDSSKNYYMRSGTGTKEDPYIYTLVENPNPSELNTYYECIYYELVGVDEAIQNYVSSQLAVDDDGLWLKTSGMDTKILLSSTAGVVLYGSNGKIIGQYGETAQIGDIDGFHIEISGNELGFYQGPNNKIAYIRNDQLYITQSVVLERMDVGKLVSDGGSGQWSWKVHENGDNPPRNNLYLKWMG